MIHFYGRLWYGQAWSLCRCRMLLFRPRCIPPSCHSHTHSPVLVNSADMLHATKRTLQMKQTWTNSISLLLRTLKIFAIIVFLDGHTVSESSRSMLRSSLGRGPLFSGASLRAEGKAAARLVSSHGVQPGCGPHFKSSKCADLRVLKRIVVFSPPFPCSFRRAF